jgi:5'-3' exonuclease
MDKKNLLNLLNNINENDVKEEKILPDHKRILLIDGLNLFFRNFAVLNYINDQGTHIGGLGGFLRSLGYLIDITSPTSVYVVFDGTGATINRKSILPDYKSNRNIQRITNWEGFESLEDENNSRIDQISRLIHYLRCLPVKILSMDKVEADDVIAHLSQKFSDENAKVFIASSDKDFTQLINEKISLYSPMEKVFYTPEKVKNKFGLLPENFILYKTLLGDQSDVVKGVKGLGPKKLFKLFPELKTKYLELKDIFKICENKFKEHVIYSKILLDKHQIENNYKVMDLKNPLVNDSEIQIMESLTISQAPPLQMDVFIHMFNEDGMVRIIKDIEWWLRKHFKTLNNIK